RHGIHLGQEAEMVTDALRALLLEREGYATRVFEFVSLEHTSKNKMILAVRREDPVDRAALDAEITALESFYGVREQRLQTLLAA
ncbi:MAG TPA: methyltransferase, partial [Caldimonas sp.]|nr:methyltransferase [Caldimonas sp.]